MLRADRDAMEAEVESSIAATNAECEAESAARGFRKNIMFGQRYASATFRADLDACVETNS